MGDFTFNVDAFRTDYPAFADDVKYPDVTLQMYWNTGNSYIDNRDCGWLAGDDRFLALNLITAHLTGLSDIIADQQNPSLIQSATVDRINVSLTPPPLENQWQWWLSLTPYGQQLLALLQVNIAGGMYIGGSPERRALRGFGGCF